MVPNEHWGCAAVPPGLIAYARFVRGVCGDTKRAYNAFSQWAPQVVCNLYRVCN